MKNWNLYVIVDRQACGNKNVVDIARDAASSGADIIQFRDKISCAKEILKNALLIKKICDSLNCIFIINDRVDIAYIADAGGVHLGQDDISVEHARMVLGPDKIIGLSTHSIKQARSAQLTGADYIGIGPVFSTPTKPDCKSVGLELVEFAAKNIKLPFVAIGGINLQNVEAVLEAGAKTVAVVRAVCAQTDVESAVKKLKERIAGFRQKSLVSGI